MQPRRGNAPIIIKRVNAPPPQPHHGGAWKVAYADFVTAMMAFFLLMWLLNATTEKQRKGLAEYFNPTVMQTSEGGSAASFGGEDAVSPDTSDRGLGASRDERMAQAVQGEESGFDAAVRHIQDELNGSGAESMQLANLLRHVITRMTDEGLIIELTDLTDAPLFDGDTAQPSAEMRELSAILTRVLGRVRNDIAISGHVRGYPEMLIHSPVWALSDARAHTVRNLMADAGFDEQRIQRVTSFADRLNRSGNPMDPNNNRIEVILLR